jgi:hypothetical protein
MSRCAATAEEETRGGERRGGIGGRCEVVNKVERSVVVVARDVDDSAARAVDA